MDLYFISGLGADERVFQRIRLANPYNIIHIQWPQLSDGENLQTYCSKIVKLIDQSKEFGIVGLSFGGIITIELTKLISPQYSIIISSISTKHEMPWHYRIAGALSIIKIIPSRMLNKVYPFTYWFFGVRDAEDRKLLKQVIADTSPKFLKWALAEILNWKNTFRPAEVFHIHGTADRLFPCRYVKANRVIEKGGHLIVYTHANEVSHLIETALEHS